MAGADQTIQEGIEVTLDASASSDPDGDPLTYRWTQIVGPSVTLSDPATAMPSFIAPVVDSDAVLTFQLLVSDGALDSAPDAVNVLVRNIRTNSPPVANAGPDQVANGGSLAGLNGSASTDPDGDPLAYSWTQVSGPAVTLSGSAFADPTFTAPRVESDAVLTFQLVVNDGAQDSAPDTAQVLVKGKGANVGLVNAQLEREVQVS